MSSDAVQSLTTRTGRCRSLGAVLAPARWGQRRWVCLLAIEPDVKESETGLRL